MRDSRVATVQERRNQGEMPAAHVSPADERRHAGVLVLDRDRRVIYADPSAGRLSGRHATELVGLPLAAALAGVLSAVDVARIDLAAGLAEASTFRFDHGEGVVLTIDVEPAEESVALVFRRRNRESRAEEARAHLAAVVAAADDAIISMTPDGMVTSWNGGAERLYGYTAEEMLGASIRRIVPVEFETEWPRLLRRASQGQRLEHFETARQDKAGRLVEVSLSVAPIFRDSRVIGVVSIAHDISPRRRQEQGLRSSEARYQQIVTTAHEGIVTLDSRLRVAFVNPRFCRMTGYDEGDLLGRPAADFLVPESNAAGRGFDGLRAGQLIEVQLRCKDGRLLWASNSASPFFDDSGQFAGLVNMFTDLTERKLAEEQLTHLALHDSLTGLPNRSLLLDRLGQAIRAAERRHGLAALLLMDLDRFKDVN
ncbi:MAG: PAS domain S-box protein, partial [Chloroflexi bacterium]|nr:PAS domain S-box protein [Chloroflexota bacterium]